MACVQDILATKGQLVHSLSPDAMVLDALELMARENIGAVPIVDNNRLAGIFTERLYARNVFLKGRASPKTSLADVMARDVVAITPQTSIDECMALMSDKRIRHLPVMAENKIVGIISIGDLMEKIIRDRELDIEHLVGYISR